MRKLPLMAALLALALGSAAHAEWVKVGITADDADYYLDADRIRKVGSKTHIWVKMDHRRDRTVNYRTSMALMSFDCGAQTWKTLSVTTFDSYGRTTSNSGMMPDYGGEAILPESVGERISLVACAGSVSDQ